MNLHSDHSNANCEYWDDDPDTEDWNGYTERAWCIPSQFDSPEHDEADAEIDKYEENSRQVRPRTVFKSFESYAKIAKCEENSRQVRSGTISGQNVDELHELEDSTLSVDIAANLPMLESFDDEEFVRFEVKKDFMLQHSVTIYDIKFYPFKVL